MSRTTTVLTITAVTALTLAVGYAAYFDYKRRTDAAFRKRLRKEQKKVHRTVNKATETTNGPSKEELREALQKVKDEKIPDSADAKEQYFMQSVSVGEQLCAQGEAFYLPAALSFYRALRVYPSPVELIIIYQKTVPEPVFKILMEMTSLDMQNRIEGYYDHFPSKDMNVSVTQTFVKSNDSEPKRKNILIVNKDIQEGEEIYSEDPIVAALDADLESSGSNCSYCLRNISSALSLKMADDPLLAVYCSKGCLAKARSESHNVLFGLDNPIPNDPSPAPVSEQALEDRKRAQYDFVKSLRNNGKTFSLLVARFIGRQVATEVAKIGISATGTSPLHRRGGVLDEEYSIADHIERLRYLELPTQKEEFKLIAKLLETAMPGLEQSVYNEKYTTLKGKMAYNAIGVYFSGERAKNPASDSRPEDIEKTRTPYGTQKQIGCGLYPISSYISHSCKPSTRPAFLDGTSSLHLIANHSLKKGDELTMAYVDVSQRQGESVRDARLRRRKELARGWRFACMCPRCVEEGPENSSSEEMEDESKVESVYNRYEENKGRREL